MKLAQTAVLMTGLMLCVFTPIATHAADQDGVAVAIIFDTSGSMNESVRDKTGKSAPKYRIAARSLEAVANQLQAYVTNHPSDPRKLHASLIIFAGDNARVQIPMAQLNADALRSWAQRFNRPDGRTPLGASLQAASQELLKSGLQRKHVMVITDGMNTVGPDPAVAMPRIKKQAEQARTSMAFHFIAFDVDAKVFAPVKKLGATVVSAADEKQLNTQLDFILQKKILLEDEEPKKQ